MRLIIASLLILFIRTGVGVAAEPLPAAAVWTWDLTEVGTVVKSVYQPLALQGKEGAPVVYPFGSSSSIQPYPFAVEEIREPIQGFRDNLALATIPIYVGLVVLILTR